MAFIWRNPHWASLFPEATEEMRLSPWVPGTWVKYNPVAMFWIVQVGGREENVLIRQGRAREKKGEEWEKE